MATNNGNPLGRLPILGIDLGTGTCLACLIQNGHPVFIRPDPNSPTDLMNSVYLAVPRKGGGYQDLVGPDAERAVEEDDGLASHLVRNVKRLMKMHANDHAYPVSNGRKISPVDVASLFLAKLREAAERQLGLPKNIRLTAAVVTVPSDFGSTELEATRLACQKAGFHEYYLLDEPVAAAYSIDRRAEEGKELALVADLGQGTFDLALLYIGQDAGKFGIAELGRGGDSLLGGLNWDQAVAEWAALQTTPIIPPRLQGLDPVRAAMLRDGYDRLGPTQDEQVRSLCEVAGYGHEELFKDAERAKRAFFARGRDAGLTGSQLISYRPLPTYKPAIAKMSSATFLEETSLLVDQCLAAIDRLLTEVSEIRGQPRIGWDSLKKIYLAGGGSRMWTVREAIEKRVNRDVVDPRDHREASLLPSPQHSVALGAAIHARAIQDGQIEPGDSLIGRPRFAHTLGIRFGGKNGSAKKEPATLIARLDPLPFRTRPPLRFTTSGKADASTLRITFVEKKRNLAPDDPADGNGDYVWQDFKTFRFTIPPSQDGGNGQEFLEIDLECEPEGVPRMDVSFRGVLLTATLERADDD